MDPRTVDMLRQLNDDFYRRCAPSFSNTRQAPWEGWRACLPLLREAALPLYGAALREDTRDAREADLSRGVVLIGSEGRGLSQAALSATKPA